jgi:ABC-type arginine transport system permease subunit
LSSMSAHVQMRSIVLPQVFDLTMSGVSDNQNVLVRRTLRRDAR